MERTFFGTSLLRKAGQAFLLATLVGSVACSGCDGDEPGNNTNNPPNNSNNSNNLNNSNNSNNSNNTNNVEMGVINVTPTTLQVNENGGTGSFSVSLAVEPVSPVVVNLMSSDDTEASVSPLQLTFNPDDWSTPQSATVTGVDDAEFDGTQMVTIATNVVATDNYAGIDAADVTVSVLDDEEAGGSVSPTAIVVREGGTGATFSVVLSAAPTGDVTIPISVSDDTEIAVDVTELTFTTADFGTAQTVTVTAIDDTEVEPDLDLQVVVGAAVGGGYDGINLADVDVTVISDDDPSVTVTPTQLTTTEAGTTGTFTVELGAPPTDDVTIDAVVGDSTEGSIMPASVTLGAGSLTGTFVVTGLDDTDPDGDQQYQVTLSASSNDAAYDGLPIPSVSVLNRDNDDATVTVMPQSLTVNEAGATSQTFTIALGSDPGENVTIDLTSSDTTEATVAPASLTFTSSDFGTPQTVTVTAVDDNEADNNTQVTINTVMNATLAYAGIDPANVSVLVVDDDVAGVTINPTQGLQTTEMGGSDQFTVVLNSQPTANVTVDLVSSDPGEGTVSPASVTFTPGTWQTAQTVTVTGVDDLQDDGDVIYNIVTTLTTTAPSYLNVNPADLLVTNIDDDDAGFIVTPNPGAGPPQRTSEDGTQVTFTVQLRTPPAANVTIPIQVTDSTEGSVAPQSLTFTPMDWSTPQTVTVTGLDDNLTDGPIQYNVILDTTTSTDPAYNNLDPPNVPIINNDNEPGFTVTPTTLTVSESGANNTATFSITLNSPPTQNVRIDLTPNGPVGDEYDVSPQQFVFTPQNWLTAQTATVTGVPDAAIDGPQNWSITVFVAQTIDTNFQANCGGLCPPVTVNGTTTDSDSIGVTVVPTEFTVSEGACQTVTVTLNTDAVTDTSFTAELSDTMTLGNNELRFGAPTGGPTIINRTIAAGTTSTSFVVCGFQDNPGIAENQKTESVVITAFTTAGGAGDPYEGLNPPDLNVTIEDDDQPAVIVEYISFFGFADQALYAAEDCEGIPFCTGLDAFTIRLATQPSTSVIVTITSSDPSEAQVSDVGNNQGPSIAFVFQTSDWNTPQLVFAESIDDVLLDGTQQWEFTFQVQSQDTFYNGIQVDPIQGFTSDDDQPGWTYIPLTIQQSTEAPGPDPAYLIANNTPPNANIDVSVTINPNTEGLISSCADFYGAGSCSVTGGGTGASATYANGTFGAMVYTVDGQDDNIIDGNQTWNVTQNAVNGLVTTDPDYISTTYPTATGINVDDDAVGIIITSLDADIDEDDSDGFNVRLASQPTANVTVTLTTSDATEGTISAGASLTFTPANWNFNQGATISGVEDNTIDGDQDITVDASATSTDVDYNGATQSAPITINDIDQGALEFDEDPPIVTNESGTTHIIRVRLTSIPTGNVVVPVYSFDTTEATVSVASLTFTPANWNVFQNVTITGVDDAVQDGNQNFTIWFDIPTSTDPAYDGLDPVSFIGTNNDNDTVGVTVIQPQNPAILVTDEDGASDTFQVVLNSQPTGTVTLVFGAIGGGACPLANNRQCVVNWPTGVNASGNGFISPGTVTFNATNWSVPQTITVTGNNNNNFTDSVVYYRVPIAVNATVVGRDTAYDGVFIDQVLGALIDNDEEDIVAIGLPIGTTGTGPGLDHYVVTGETGAQGRFWIRATELPTNNVTVAIGLSSEVTGQNSFTLTQSNYNQLNEIVLTGADDANIVDPLGLNFHTVTLTATSTDPDYNGAATSILGANADDDECVLWQLPDTSSDDLIAGGSPQVPVPFAFGVGADPPINPVQTFVDFSGSVLERDQNQTFSTGGVPTLFYAYGTSGGGSFSVDHDVILGDACYTNAGGITLNGDTP